MVIEAAIAKANALVSLGSLFSGIGGLELGLEAAGLGPTQWQVELDDFCRKVLAKHWPEVSRDVVDVREAGKQTLPFVRLICGGFPCQDVSAAGRGAGLAGARSGLWWEFHRVITEIEPQFVVVENVASGKGRWLCAVRGSLHELGYDTAAIQLSAENVGAPHRRARVFIVAALADDYREGKRQSGGPVLDERRRARDCDSRARPSLEDTHCNTLRLGEQWFPEGREGGVRDEGDAIADDRCQELGDPNSSGREPRSGLGGPRGSTAERASRGLDQPGMGRDIHGISEGLDRHQWPAGRGVYQHAFEPPRIAKPRSIPQRAERVKALGNSVVPQCAMAVGRYLRALL